MIKRALSFQAGHGSRRQVGRSRTRAQDARACTSACNQRDVLGCELGPVLALDYYVITARPPGCNCIEPVVLFIAACPTLPPSPYRIEIVHLPYLSLLPAVVYIIFFFDGCLADFPDNSLADFSTPDLKRSLIIDNDHTSLETS